MGLQIFDGRKVVAAAGTAVTITSATLAVFWVVFTAETDNTGIIALGGSTVVAAQTTQRGLLLLAGESSPPMFDADLNLTYIDATVTGDGVSYAYLV